MRMKKHPQYFISKSPLRGTGVGTTIGIDLGDVWSHYCTINEEGEVIDRGRFRTNPSGVDKRFRDLEPIRIAMEAGTHVDQRADTRSAPRSDGGKRARAAGDLTQRSQERFSGRREAGTICAARSRDPSSDCTSHGSAAGDTDADSCPRCAGAPANRRGELSSRTGEAMRLPSSSIVDTVLCKTMPGDDAAWAVRCAQPAAPSDRRHDSEDQGV